MRHNSLTVALVGMGVRGTECVLQLADIADRIDPRSPIHLHLIDPYEAGAGRTWRTDQSPLLLMNNTVNGVTVYASGVDAGLEGPTFWEWVLQLRDGSAHSTQILGTLPTALYDEVHRLASTDFASRALYGEYVAAALEHGLSVLADRVVVQRHRAAVSGVQRATPHDQQPAPFTLELSDGGTLVADQVVLSLGWLSSQFAAPAGFTEGHRWITPGHPADQALGDITPEDTVFIRGLGMSFFDTLTLLTQGRGGTFEAEAVTVQHGDKNSSNTVSGEFAQLRYVASGNEPRVLVGSGRGVPYRSKRTAATVGAQHESLDTFLRQVRDRMQVTVALAASDAVSPNEYSDEATVASEPGIDFSSEVWPRVQQDALVAYYATLERVHPERMAVVGWAGKLAGVTPERALLCASDGVTNVSDACDLRLLEFPAADLVCEDSDSLQQWIRDWVLADLRETERSYESPLKAASRVIGAARPRVAFLLEDGLLSAASMPAYRRFMALGSMLQGGPPPQRALELLALSRAGVVRFVGAAPQVTAVGESGTAVFAVSSPTVPGETVQATVLLDAWVHAPEALLTVDVLLHGLISSGLARPHISRGRPSGAVEVDTKTFELVQTDGSRVSGLYSLGIPHEGQRVFTILSPQPGVHSPLLEECRTVAESLVLANTLYASAV